jgi:hypothetical protein
MQRISQRIVQMLVFLTAAVCTGLAHAGWDIKIIHYPGADFTTVGGINGAGQVVGSATFEFATPDEYAVSFIYDPRTETFTDLPQPPADYGLAFAINDSGIVAGNMATSTALGLEVTDGFILDKKGTFSTFSHPGYLETQTRAIGNTGLVTGFAGDSVSAIDRVGFIYDPARGTYTDITIPGGFLIFAQGINGRGDVVGSVRNGSTSALSSHGYLRDRKGYIALFRVNDGPTSARGINDAGLIAGFVAGTDGVSRGFVAKLPGGPGVQAVSVPDAELIEVPGADITAPQSVDNRGRVVGFWLSATDQQGFIATPTK